jgi:maltose alpha-D-glucosyltransferase/alpha-amylase
VKKLASAIDPLWYKDAIIYELHVRAFADSNGDGIGDFPGLMSRLDYLQDLGVTCIWLLPFFPSPSARRRLRHRQLRRRQPLLRHAERLQAFLDAAHQRNMQVMIELVINHTSDQHPWFKAARLRRPTPRHARCMSGPIPRPALQRRPHHLHRHGEIQLDLGRDAQQPTTGIASSPISPI